MAIDIDFNDNKVFGGSAVLSTPSDADVTFKGGGNEFHGVTKIFDVRKSSSHELLEKLGLKDDADLNLINEVLIKLASMPNEPAVKKTEEVEKSGITKWLNVGVTASTLTKNLVDLVQQMSGG
ncbi:hypothetical protein [Pseudomonas fluorescens]|uniref:Uncharacterized protein n=1 Tax=Pseudomonas fluorescens TaxID=294 RepID=A0A5E6QZE2_PSEFL|nr:hypothetical protein [Pseudomonas fluorescens]VVM59825.1 hypothetical protein PS659_01258 [Pseudomonas fluorescens]